MKDFLVQNAWTLPFAGLGVSTLWTLFQWRAKVAEQRTAQVQVEISREHRITSVEGRLDTHETRLSLLEGRK